MENRKPVGCMWAKVAGIELALMIENSYPCGCMRAPQGITVSEKTERLLFRGNQPWCRFYATPSSLMKS